MAPAAPALAAAARILLLLACVAAARAQTVWEVRFDEAGDGASVSVNGTLRWTGAVAESDGSFNVSDGVDAPIVWFATPRALNASEVAALRNESTFGPLLASFSGNNETVRVQQLARGLFRAWSSFENPNLGVAPVVVHLGFAAANDTLSHFACDPTTLTVGFRPFACFPLAPAANTSFSARLASSPSLFDGVTLQLNDSGVALPERREGIRGALLALLALRAKRIADFGQTTAEVETLNADRQRDNKAFASATWALAVIGMFAMVVAAVALQMWMLPVCRPAVALWVWVPVAVCLPLLLGGTAGILGWLAVGLFFALHWLAAAVVWCCTRKKRATLASGDAVSHSVAIELSTSSLTDKAASSEALAPSGCERIVAPLQCASCPGAPGRLQKILVAVSLTSLAVVVAVAAGLWFGAWDPSNYRVVDRTSLRVEEEVLPTMSARAVATVYSHERLATTLKLQPFFEWATETCGRVFKRLLTTDEEKRREIYEEFIVKYSVDMSDYRLQHYLNFTSVNDWFIRELRDDARPIAAPNDSAVVVSPADARVVVFQNVPPDHRAWIKGARFSVSSLLDDHPGINMSAFAAGASLAIVRLAPQDYHRFHAPVAGTITHQYRVDGLLHSVNSDAMRSDNDAIFNQRIVTIIENPRIGPVAFVAIGALCVGSVQMTRVEGATVAKGEELGYFQFGGSTIALLLPSRALGLGAVFDDDLVVHSRYLVETRVLMGQQIARQP